MSKASAWAMLLSVFLLVCCNRRQTLDESRIRGAAQDSANWLMYGRTYDDHRFSPLNQINEQTVAKLGLAWSRELSTTRGLEATPLVEDGVLYTTGSWSVVDALDAKTGDVRWIRRCLASAHISSAAMWSIAVLPFTAARCTWEPWTAA
jgi:quinohemoprotein ethanol dehydrogenase